MLFACAWMPIAAQSSSSTVQRIRIESPGAPSLEFLYDVKTFKLVGLEFENPDSKDWIKLTGDGTITINPGPPAITIYTAVRGQPGRSATAFRVDVGGELTSVYQLLPNGTYWVMTPNEVDKNPNNKWSIQPLEHSPRVVASKAGLDGEYVRNGSIVFRLVIKGSTFKMYWDDRLAGVGTVTRDGDQIVLNDQKSMIVFDLVSSGDLTTEVTGLAGTWQKVRP